MCDLLWSDPEEDIVSWHTSSRGCGYLFGADVVKTVGMICLYLYLYFRLITSSRKKTTSVRFVDHTRW